MASDILLLVCVTALLNCGSVLLVGVLVAGLDSGVVLVAAGVRLKLSDDAGVLLIRWIDAEVLSDGTAGGSAVELAVSELVLCAAVRLAEDRIDENGMADVVWLEALCAASDENDGKP